MAMGRFGNVMLVSRRGRPLARRRIAARSSACFLTNTANTRVFNLTMPGARMKLVGGDSGRYEREEYVDEVLIAPSERAVVDVLFDHRGDVALDHRTPDHDYELGTITVARKPRSPRSADAFATLRTNADMVAERERVAPHLEHGPRQDARVRRGDGHGRARGASRLRVPDAPRDRERRAWLLPEVRDEAPCDRVSDGDDVRLPDAPRSHQRCAGSLPTVRHEARADHSCQKVDTSTRPRAPHDARARCTTRRRGSNGKTTWSRSTVTTPANMRWKLVDRSTGAENARDRLALPRR